MTLNFPLKVAPIAALILLAVILMARGAMGIGP